jgi:hypothetical protein
MSSCHHDLLFIILAKPLVQICILKFLEILGKMKMKNGRASYLLKGPEAVA